MALRGTQRQGHGADGEADRMSLAARAVRLGYAAATILILGLPLFLVIRAARAGTLPEWLGPWLEPQPVLSLAALGVGFVLLSWQLRVQHRNIRQEARDRLNLEIYAELAKRIEATRQPITRLGTAPSGLLMLLRLPRPPKTITTGSRKCRRLSTVPRIRFSHSCRFWKCTK